MDFFALVITAFCPVIPASSTTAESLPPEGRRPGADAVQRTAQDAATAAVAQNPVSLAVLVFVKTQNRIGSDGLQMS